MGNTNTYSITKKGEFVEGSGGDFNKQYADKRAGGQCDRSPWNIRVLSTHLATLLSGMNAKLTQLETLVQDWELPANTVTVTIAYKHKRFNLGDYEVGMGGHRIAKSAQRARAHEGRALAVLENITATYYVLKIMMEYVAHYFCYFARQHHVIGTSKKTNLALGHLFEHLRGGLFEKLEALYAFAIEKVERQIEAGNIVKSDDTPFDGIIELTRTEFRINPTQFMRDMHALFDETLSDRPHKIQMYAGMGYKAIKGDDEDFVKPQDKDIPTWIPPHCIEDITRNHPGIDSDKIKLYEYAIDVEDDVKDGNRWIDEFKWRYQIQVFGLGALPRPGQNADNKDVPDDLYAIIIANGIFGSELPDSRKRKSCEDDSRGQKRSRLNPQ